MIILLAKLQVTCPCELGLTKDPKYLYDTMSMSAVASPEKVAESMVTVNGGFQPAPIRLGNIVTTGTTTTTSITTARA